MRSDKDGGQFKRDVLAAMKADAVEQAVVEKKEEQPGWIALRKLLPE